MKWLEELVEAAHADLGERERGVLLSRGVSQAQIDTFRIGYIERDLPDGNYPQTFTSWWIGNRSKLDDVFVLPLTNTVGHVLGIQVRHVDRARKGYLDFFATDEECCLFGLGPAMAHVWESGSIWLVEGAFDLMPLQRHLPNSVATMHAGISSSFLKVLKRVATELHIAYDSDSAGMQAAYAIRKDLRGIFEVHIHKFPQVPYKERHTKDPNELWEVWGDKKLGVYISQQLGFVPFSGEIHGR